LKPIFIHNASAVTPQNSLTLPILTPLRQPVARCLHAIEPDYGDMIPPMQLRRLSRILKIAIFAGLDCLQKSGIAQPDAIIIGTGKGNLTETEKFLKECQHFEFESLNPTPFILSTYNAVNGAMALQTKATGYNQTFVHRGSSFELSLLDAQMLLQESESDMQVLAGCFDEITAEYLLIKDKLHYWKKNFDPARPLWLQPDRPGSIAGEGAAFFLLCGQAKPDALGIHHIHLFSQVPEADLPAIIAREIALAGWETEDLDMLLLGLNGDSRDEPFYQRAMTVFSPNIPVMAFKHLCGEYETAGGFAFWLLAQYGQGHSLPAEVWYRKPEGAQSFRKILYYNHFRGDNHNLVLLSLSA
jgi:hypothetical protein